MIITKSIDEYIFNRSYYYSSYEIFYPNNDILRTMNIITQIREIVKMPRTTWIQKYGNSWKNQLSVD